VLSSCVFAVTQPRTVFTSLPSACTLPRGSNARCNAFRINTCKSLSKQTTLTVIESYSYKKHRGWRVLWLTSSRFVVTGYSLCTHSPLFAQIRRKFRPLFSKASTLFHFPYPVSPVFATLTKTAGCIPTLPILELNAPRFSISVCGFERRTGTQRSVQFARF